MGGLDGAEKCNIVGLYILSKLNEIDGIEAGLFRDDGAAITKLPPKEAERVKNKIVKVFKDEGLDITIVANLKVMNFLDVEVDLNTGTHRPYTKPNNTLLYIDINSNHPPSALKNTVHAVQSRLSMLSSNREIFEQAAPPYQEALDRAGYTHKLQFTQLPLISRRKQSRRKEIWFNPPWAQNVKTNIGKILLEDVAECFPVGQSLHSILNRHTLKISYRTMPNMAQIISRHNAQILKKQQPVTAAQAKTCSCPKAVRDSDSCPLGGQCLLSNTIYQATVTQVDSGKVQTYTGLASTEWKKRLAVHKSSIRHRAKPGAKSSNSTELSNHTWDLKDKKIDYTISWKIIDRAQPFNPSTKMCRLCLTEKYHLMYNEKGATLNNRDEFYSACRHQKGKLISNG